MPFLKRDYQQLLITSLDEIDQAFDQGKYEELRQLLIKTTQICLELSDVTNGQEKESYIKRAEQMSLLIQSIPNKVDQTSGNPNQEKSFSAFDLFKSYHSKEPSKETSSNSDFKKEEDDSETEITVYQYKWDDVPSISFDDVAGLYDVKESVSSKVLLPLLKPELYEGYGKTNGGGLLLYGPPGTGKTMIAAAIAHEVNAKFCTITSADVLNSGLGNSEKAVRALFQEARSFNCAIIFFDEIESIAPRKTASTFVKQFRSEFLRQFQGIDAYMKNDKKHILLIIGATNKPWEIDTAFLRSGRFDTRLYIGLPDDDAKWYIVDKNLKKIKQMGIVNIDEQLSQDEILRLMKGFNGADVDNFMQTVMESSIKRSIQTGIKSIGIEDFYEASRKVVSSVVQEDLDHFIEWQSKF